MTRLSIVVGAATSVLGGLLCGGVFVGCGGDDAGTTIAPPPTEEFTLAADGQMAIERAVDTGKGAEGTYVYDETGNTVDLTITASTFVCGIVEGVIHARVVELTATTMVWAFEEGGGTATWTRIDAMGSGVVGVWRTEQPDYILFLTGDGKAAIYGEGEACVEDRRRNGERCVEVIPSDAAITIDGELGDWDAVGVDAVVPDAMGDQQGGDPGADIRAMKVARGTDGLYVLLQLHGAPNPEFWGERAPNGGSYRLTVRGSNGLSEIARVVHEPDSATWNQITEGTIVTSAVGADGVEWRVDLSAVAGEGFRTVELILVEVVDFGQGSGVSLDPTDCAFFNVR